MLKGNKPFIVTNAHSIHVLGRLLENRTYHRAARARVNGSTRWKLWSEDKGDQKLILEVQVPIAIGSDITESTAATIERLCLSC